MSIITIKASSIRNTKNELQGQILLITKDTNNIIAANKDGERHIFLKYVNRSKDIWLLISRRQ